MSTILGILIGLLILSIMMFVHELGHFLAGRALGFKVISFNMFMGPILYRKTGKNGTVFTLRLIPMGASVEFAGEDSGINELPEDADPAEIAAAKLDPEDPGLFYNRPRWARAIVVAMGPLVNFLTAFLAFCILFMSYGVQIPVVSEVAPRSAAAEAGIQSGDRILEVNHERISSVLDYNMATGIAPREADLYKVKTPQGELREMLVVKELTERYLLGVNYQMQGEAMLVSNVDPRSNEGFPVLEKNDKILAINGIPVSDEAALVQLNTMDNKDKVELKIERKGQEQTVDMRLTALKDYAPVGLQLAQAEHTGQALGQAVVYPDSVVRSTFKGLGMIFSGQLKAKDGLTGPIGIVALVGDVVENESASASVKFEQLLMLFGLISVAVGFTNLLPIPPFDGFHLLVLIIEGIIRRDLPEKVKQGFSMVGIALIFLLVAYVFYIDIARLFF